MNKKKAREKRIYKQGLMTRDERDAYNKERAEERLLKERLSNKKAQRRFPND